MKVERLAELEIKLKAMANEAGLKGNVSVVVGYTQTYAVKVHEDLTARHKEGKEAKYLETPARRLAPEIKRTVRREYAKTRDMEMSLLVGGLRLQRESQKIVPIDTSALKASAYSALERDAEAASNAAFLRSEAVRIREEGMRAKKRAKKKS